MRQFSRPSTYNPDLAYRTSQHEQLDLGQLALQKRREAMKTDLGLEEHESSEEENDEQVDSKHCTITSHSDNELKQQLKLTKEELKMVIERERKVQSSLSKLQLMSKSQCAILKNNFIMKLQQKEQYILSLLSTIEKEAPAIYSTVKADFQQHQTLHQIDDPIDSEQLVSKELHTLRAQVQSLENENQTLSPSIQALQESSLPDKDVPKYKKKIEKLEKEKAQLMTLIKEAQIQLKQQSKSAPVLTTQEKAEPAANTAEKDEKIIKLKKQLNEAKKVIQQLNEKLQHASATPPAVPSSVSSTAVDSEEFVKLKLEYKKLKEEKVTLAKDSEAKLTLGISKLQEENKKLVHKHEKELQQLKSHAKRAILDLRQKLQSSSGTKAQYQSLLTAVQGQKRQLQLVRQDMVNQLHVLPTLSKDVASKLTAYLQKQQLSMAGVVSNYERELKERKRLFNLLQELRGNIRVFCRFRPVKDQGSTSLNIINTDTIQMTNDRGKTKSWEFDFVFNDKTDQIDVFKQVEPMVDSFLDGYNVSIFAYGQTGSGKTHTMSGPLNNPGINLRALQKLFTKSKARENEMQDQIQLSMLEIYNEQIFDLLTAETTDSKKALTIRQGPQGNYVPDLTLVPVDSYEQVLELIELGNVNRSTHATNMNEYSSRSHSILSISITSMNLATNQSTKSQFHLVDLAGSERLSRTGATGQRLKEAQNINKSLSALGDVIAARAKKTSHIPYRNSQLTYLLQDSLGGDAKTLMMACASPLQANAEESFCTLNFAERTRKVEMGKATKQTVKS